MARPRGRPFKFRHCAADFDDDTHGLVPQNVAVLHRRLIAVEKVQIRTTDCCRGDFDDGVRRFLNGRIGDGIDANVVFAVPAECSHGIGLRCEFIGERRGLVSKRRFYIGCSDLLGRQCRSRNCHQKDLSHGRTARPSSRKSSFSASKPRPRNLMSHCTPESCSPSRSPQIGKTGE